jgi:hypothetical protein
MAEHLHKVVVFVGKAQEKTSVFLNQRRGNPQTGQTYPWIVKSTATVNHHYIVLCLNGHEYAKRQLALKGIVFEALDNGILSCAELGRLQKICDGLGAEKIDGFLRK